MSDTKTGYVLEDTAFASEHARLQALEGIYDAATQRRLEAAGLGAGWHCLEVGAGAGSVATWMSEHVGPTGHVVALDLNTRFLAGLERDNLAVVKGDIRLMAFEANTFDLIHARFVLSHLRDVSAAFQTILHALKPGGLLVVEELDFSAARWWSNADDQSEHCVAFERIDRAYKTMLAAGGFNPAFGSTLPSLFHQLGLTEIDMENDATLVNGGSPSAALMRMSTIQVRNHLSATGHVSAQDFAHFYESTEDPTCWAVYYATVRGTGRKPLAS